MRIVIAMKCPHVSSPAVMRLCTHIDVNCIGSDTSMYKIGSDSP